jgi:hypothetical protein
MPNDTGGHSSEICEVMGMSALHLEIVFPEGTKKPTFFATVRW